ncbi:MAG: Uma2 family endonuclease [Desulfoferrobacter sp.]
MTETAINKASYEDLFRVPENMVGEIIAGELVVTPRPSRKHAYSASALGGEIVPPYQFGRGAGPGGWIILFEPEIMLGEHIIVPDLTGWRRDRFPDVEDTNWISVFPDWACEILSPGTVRVDRVKKMPIYSQHSISHLWIIDPTAKTLEVFKLKSGSWILLESFAENDRVRVEPFQEAEIDLGNLWLE